MRFTAKVLSLLAICNCCIGEWIYSDIPVVEGPLNQLEKPLIPPKSNNASTVRYHISGDFTNEFRYDELTGLIYQIAELDREIKSVYAITVTAEDVNGNPTEEPTSFKVHVEDINDNIPEFDKDSLTGSIAENHNKVDGFMKVVATDADIGFNGDIVYSIELNSDVPESATGARFVIDKNTGDVRLSGELDYETIPVVKFTVIATDGGGRDDRLDNKDRTAEVTVHVIDSNNHAPEFELTNKSLSELSKIDQPLYNIYATDKDEGVNKKVYFEIVSGNTGGTFRIVSRPSNVSRSLGQLMLIKQLDFESGVTVYNLSVRALNTEAEESTVSKFATTKILKVTVIDENESPTFTNTPYSVKITEEQAPKRHEPIITIHAQDIDFGGNQTVTYSIDDPARWFHINSTTGEISVRSVVDREATWVSDGLYTLKVIATDDYNNGPRASASETVSIIIDDINDNPPEWNSDGNEAYICEQPHNTTVKVIKSYDADSVKNGKKFHFRFNESVDTLNWGFEEVNDDTQIVVAKFSDYGLTAKTAKVNLPFTITDSGTPAQTSTAALIVNICKCRDDPIVACVDAPPNIGSNPLIIVVAVILVIVLIVLIVIFGVWYRPFAGHSKNYEADGISVTQTLQMHQEECGESDNTAFDMSILITALTGSSKEPTHKDDQTTKNADNGLPIRMDSDSNFGPHDSLFVFSFEGTDSAAGSLSSIDTATTDGSDDYDYLREWGPKFNRLAEIYQDRL